MRVTVDSFPPQKYRLQVESISVNLNLNSASMIQSITGAQTSELTLLLKSSSTQALTQLAAKRKSQSSNLSSSQMISLDFSVRSSGCSLDLHDDLLSSTFSDVTEFHSEFKEGEGKDIETKKSQAMTDLMGFHAFLCGPDKSNHSRTVVAYKYIPYSELLVGRAQEELVRLSSSCYSVSRNSCDYTFNLNKVNNPGNSLHTTRLIHS
jgi:hypothetical protein